MADEVIDPIHLTGYVIRPVLKDLGIYTDDAGKLVLGTACQESECGLWLRQLGNGPARGVYQSERPPLIDNVRFLNTETCYELKAFAQSWFIARLDEWHIDEIHDEIVWNLAGATIMCRVHYLRFSEPIPNTLPGQAAYWKQYYNTVEGAGTEEEYIAAWRRFVPAELQWV